MTSRSPLAALDLALQTDAIAAGVRIGERVGIAKVALHGDARDAGLLRAAQEAWGAALPAPGVIAAGTGSRQVMAFGPGEWLLALPGGDGAAEADRLARAVRHLHALALDATGAWTVLRIAGPLAIELLAGLVAIDLDPSVLGPTAAAQCAVTRLGTARVLLAAVDETPAFDLYLPRSLARGLWMAIIETARPFGVAVVPAS